MTSSPTTTLLFTLLAAVAASFALGLTLLLRSRRRVGFSPHCSKCDYVVYGNTSAVCPECGQPLTPQNIARGDRRPSPPRLVLGAILLVGALIAAATIGKRTVRDYDWYQLRPTAWVIDDAQSSKPNANPIRAWGELERRRAANKLSPSHQRAIIEMALRVQTANSQETPPVPVSLLTRDLLNFLGESQLQGKLTPDESKRFFENACRTRLRVRPLVVHGDAAPIEVSHIGAGPTGPWWTRYDATSLKVGDQEIGDGGTGSGIGFGRGTSTQLIPSPPPGNYPVTFTQTIQVFHGEYSFDGKDSRLLHQWTSTNKATLRVVEKPPPDYIKRIEDPNLAQAIQNAVAIKQITLAENQHPQSQLTFRLEIRNPPAALAFEIILQRAGHEYPLGTADVAKGKQTNWGVHRPWPKDLPRDIQTADIVLRPSEKVARETVDLFELWNQEILLRNIPVTRSPKRGSTQ